MKSREKRVIVKLGSSSLTHSNGKLNLLQIEKLVRQMAELKNIGHEVVLVTSGAIAAGMSYLHHEKRPKTIPEKQACAAVGQGKLLHLYEKLFSEYGYTVGQILLTKEDFADRERFLNSRSALNELLLNDIIPVINENDAVAVSEIKFGDNDTLSALVSGLVGADCLIILSDIDGLFDKNPQLHKDAKLLRKIEEIDEKIEALAGDSISSVGTGGMRTKINAAKIATGSGVDMIIAKSFEDNILVRIMEGEEIGTLFVAKDNYLKLKKNWIAYNAKIKGTIYIDEGAKDAVLKNKSLLPSGIINIKGDFKKGDVIGISYEDTCFAKGLSYFSSEDLKKIMGRQSKEIEGILGVKDYDEAVHKDNLVI